MTRRRGEDLRRSENRLSEHGWESCNALRTYLFLYAEQRAWLLLSALLYVVKHSPAVLLPVITGLSIDLLASGAPLEKVWLYVLGAAILIGQNLPGHYFQVRLLSRSIRQVERELRLALSQRIQQLSIGYYQHKSPATLQAKMLRDVEAIEQMTRALADGLLGAGSAIVVALAVTAWRAPQFLVLFLVTVPAASALVISTRIRLAEHNNKYRQAVEGMSAKVNEMTMLLPLTRAHGVEQQALERVEDSFQRVSREGLALDSVNAWFNGLAWVCFQGLNLACLAVAAWVFHTQVLRITLGDVVLLSGFFTSLTGAVLGLAGTLPQINKGLESIKSIGELMRSTDVEHNEGKTALRTVLGRIAFENVTYRYRNASRDALHETSLVAEPGETIALVGPSGSGKSTFANLVIGTLRPTRGRILLDDHDMQTIDLRSWRQFLSVVPQDCVLFEGSVRDNVTYGLGPVREDRFQQALADAYCLEFVESLPHGADTIIGGSGGLLSGGQRQRLAIARALVRDPRVLVLDEASSALDNDSERHVQQALDKLRHGRTTFVVAHRMSTIRNADRIVVMDAGMIVDIGSHAELISRSAVYPRLCQAGVSAVEAC